MHAIRHPKLQRLFDYWEAKRGGRRMPARSDIDPIEFAFILGNIILVDVVGGPTPQFRIRLHGSRLANRVGYELTGKLLDEMPSPEFRELTRRTFIKVTTTGEPLHTLNERVMDDRTHRYEALVVPLSNDGEHIDMLMCGLLYDDDRQWNE